MSAGAAAVSSSRFPINWKAEEFRRVKPAEREAIEKRLQTLENVEATVCRMITAMFSEDWAAQKELTCEAMPFYALAGYTRKIPLLAKESFFSLLYFWAAGQQNGFMGVRTLTTEGDGETLLGLLQLPEGNTPAKERLANVVTKMQQKPGIEQRFFLFPEKTSIAVIERLRTLKISPFAKGFLESDAAVHIIPSFTLLQTYMEVRYEGLPVKGNPVLGSSTLEDIRQGGLTQVRDIGFPFPGVALPATADGLEAPWHSFTTHDVYHWMRMQPISAPLQRLTIEVADLCKYRSQAIKTCGGLTAPIWSIVARYDDEVASLTSLRASLIDMDAEIYQFLESRHLPDYESNIGLKPEDCFWHFLNRKMQQKVTSPALTTELLKKICRHLHACPRTLGVHRTPETGSKAFAVYHKFAMKARRFDKIFAPSRMTMIQQVWFSELVNKVENDIKNLSASELDVYLKKHVIPLLTLENCLAIFDHSVTAKCTPLTVATMHYIKGVLENLKKTEQFEQYLLDQPKRCATLLKRIATSG